MTNPTRVANDTSRHATEDKTKCPYGQHYYWRTVLCDGGDLDIVECSRCGQQRQVRCNFDEEYS